MSQFTQTHSVHHRQRVRTCSVLVNGQPEQLRPLCEDLRHVELPVAREEVLIDRRPLEHAKPTLVVAKCPPRARYNFPNTLAQVCV